MGEAIAWWLTIEILGLVALPVAAVLLRPLPDRGYAVSKILGLLLVGWLAYTLAMLQIFPFGRLSLLFCLLVVAGFSVWLLRRKGGALGSELRTKFSTPSFIRYIIIAEVLFTLAYVTWAIVRAYNPDIWAQEKFMDFGILNSMLKSGTFPPHDMWFAGYPINYYYFGYVLMAALTSLSGVPSQIGFNLANVTLFALTALGSFGLVHNVISGSLQRWAASAEVEARRGTGTASRRLAHHAKVVSAPQSVGKQPVQSQSSKGRAGEHASRVPALATAAKTATAIIPKTAKAPVRAGSNGRDGREQGRMDLTENAPPAKPPYDLSDLQEEPVYHIPFFLSPYVYAVLAALMVVAMGNLTTMFAVKDPSQDINANGWKYCFNCQTANRFDWWGPSRIIVDYKTTQTPGQAPQKQKVGYETINEFPAFSFLLADMHPHVLTLPLVLLTLSAAYAVSRRKVLRGANWADGVPQGVGAWAFLLISSIIIGALYTSNTWDYPTYLLVFVVCLAIPYMVAQRQSARRGWQWVRPWLVQTALTGFFSLFAFLPFHLTFKSFAGGEPAQLPENIAKIPVLGGILEKLGGFLLINTADKTITGFLVIFGIFLVALLGWLGFELVSFYRRNIESNEGTRRNFVILGAFFVVTVALGLLFKFPLLVFLLPLIVISVFLIWQEPERTERNVALALFAVAAAVGLAIEVVYLHDNFGNRMNTLFKFYYQIWVLWALAAGYAVWRVLYAAFGTRREMTMSRSRIAVEDAPIGLKALSGIWAAGFFLLVLSGLMYSVYGPMMRQVAQQRIIKDADGSTHAQFTLDGSTHFQYSSPYDLDAINWLKQQSNSADVVLECCRDEYEYHSGRISAFTGVPTLIAWDASHEALWRSGQPELRDQVGQRRQLVDSIYQGINPNDASRSKLTAQQLLDILHQYKVTYVVVGQTERGEQGAAGQFPEERVTPEAEAVFKEVLSQAFTSGSTVVYKVPPANASQNPTGGAQPLGPAPHP